MEHGKVLQTLIILEPDSIIIMLFSIISPNGDSDWGTKEDLSGFLYINTCGISSNFNDNGIYIFFQSLRLTQ